MGFLQFVYFLKRVSLVENYLQLRLCTFKKYKLLIFKYTILIQNYRQILLQLEWLHMSHHLKLETKDSAPLFSKLLAPCISPLQPLLRHLHPNIHHSSHCSYLNSCKSTQFVEFSLFIIVGVKGSDESHSPQPSKRNGRGNVKAATSLHRIQSMAQVIQEQGASESKGNEFGPSTI